MNEPVRSAAQELREALVSFDPAALEEKMCATIAAELAVTEKACAAARVLATRRAVERGEHRKSGYSDAASWLARQGGTTTSQARHDLETAAGLDSLPDTRQALLAGEVSLAQAHEITKAEAESPGQEQDLLAAAKETDLSGFRDLVRDRRQRAMRPEDLHERQQRARRFRHWRDDLGMVCFQGALAPQTGIPFVSRIEQLAKRLRRTAAGDGDRGGKNLDPFEAYAADAIVAITSQEDTAAVPRSSRAEIVFVCDLFAYRRGHAQAGEVCHIVGGGPVPVTVVRDVATDAFIKAVLHDGVEIHTVKHFGRHLPAELRTALDLGPVPSFTGRQCAECGRRFGLEYDHIDPVAHRGPTSYENLAARCYTCHQAKTERDRKAGLLGERERRRLPGARGRASRDADGREGRYSSGPDRARAAAGAPRTRRTRAGPAG
ncbi:MAG: HNH endonuclease [Acidimicrobiales bacterium]